MIHGETNTAPAGAINDGGERSHLKLGQGHLPTQHVGMPHAPRPGVPAAHPCVPQAMLTARKGIMGVSLLACLCEHTSGVHASCVCAERQLACSLAAVPVPPGAP